MRTLAWRIWERTPERLRAAVRPALAAVRRRRRVYTPLPPGEPPPLPGDAVELDTAVGTLWFDAGDRHLTPWVRSQGVWEADVMKLLRRVLRPGGTFVDVGANVGFHSILAAQLVGAGGTVYSVEPAPWTLELLRANDWRHGAGLVVLPFAAADAPGTARLAHGTSHRSGARLATGHDGVEVRSERLDALLPEGSADVLKADVEGAEPLVLRGATGLLARSPGLIAVVEFRNERHLTGESPEEVLAFYESLGLELCLLRRNGDLRRASRAAVLERSRKLPSLNIVLRRP